MIAPYILLTKIRPYDENSIDIKYIYL